MAEDFRQPQGEWSALEALEARIARGEKLTLEEGIRDLLRKVGHQVALAPEYVAERLRSVDGAEALVREESARITTGSQALSDAILAAWKHARAGNPEEGYAALAHLIQTEAVPWYRECARRERERIKAWVEATRTP